jgi:hypothetical protein
MRAYAIGDLARVSGREPPYEEGELVDGNLTIRPGTIYLGTVRWWQYTEDPKQLYCTICRTSVTNYYLAISEHVATAHAPGEI